MLLLSRLLASALILLVSSLLAHSASPPQYVIISFDGAYHIEQWERSRALARRTGARFTYFLSCVYLLSPDTKKVYRAPGMKAGQSNVGSALSREEIVQRLEQIWQARKEGHEIASHACGHFDGAEWDAAAWNDEFDQFHTILRDAWTINELPGEPADWRRFVDEEIVGFRAPYLSTDAGLFKALHDKGFRYDASTVSKGPAEPAVKDGVVRFSLPLIPEGPQEKRIIAMDYNLYVRHSDGEERPEQADLFADRAYAAFLTAFGKEYAGDRTPFQIGFHFTLMNGGAYWNALERFAGEVCSKPDVRCVSYRQYLDETGLGAGPAVGKVGG